MYISVLIWISDPPTVKVSIIPEVAAELSDAVLTCIPVDGNPLMLSSVRWFHNGIRIQAELTDDERGELTLKNLTRDRSGNYTCRGLNMAGWSLDSPPKYLDIHCKYQK